ncbi:MAG: M48 family metallopeptidase [Methylophilaceae bacterium]
METLKRKILLALILFAIPILGYLTSLYVASSYETQFKEILVPRQISESEYINKGLSYLGVCSVGGTLRSNPDWTEICSAADEIMLARQAVYATAALGVFLVSLIFIAKFISGTNRKKLAKIFGPTVRIVMFLLAISVLAQAALFIYSIYTLESSAIHRVHGGILLIVGIAAIVGCYNLLKSAVGFFRTPPSWLRAKSLSKEDNPELYNLVESISTTLNSQGPNNIVVGLEPNFFVTSNEVQLGGSDGPNLKGRTLYLSLSLMRIFTKNELISVIGHELGHFRGEDTEYSKKFAPIYSKLSTGLQQMQGDQQNVGVIATLPAVALLNLCLEQFATVERTIGRERELIADKAGAEASSSKDLARALIKVSLYTSQWDALTKKHIELLSEGNYFHNLALTYSEICGSLHSELNWSEAQNILGQYVQTHPIDTHPPMSERLNALGIPISEIELIDVRPAEDASILLIPNADEYEKEMTLFEIKFLQAIGVVVIPQD